MPCETAYQESKGMKVPHHIEIQRDGQTYMEVEVIAITLLERLDDTVFAKP